MATAFKDFTLYKGFFKGLRPILGDKCHSCGKKEIFINQFSLSLEIGGFREIY